MANNTIDVGYFKKKLEGITRSLRDYTPDELTRELTRLAAVASALHPECKAALSDIDKCEPVAEAIRERDRLGFSVVNVIGKLDEIIENTQEVEIDDFLHIAVPIDMWNELQAALEDMPKRADLYTSPQPIEKSEPVYLISSGAHEIAVSKAKYDEWTSAKRISYTSPQPRDWVGEQWQPKEYPTNTKWFDDNCILVRKNTPEPAVRFNAQQNTTRAEIITGLRNISAEMIELGAAIDYFYGLNPLSAHGAEMVGAGRIAATWADEMEKEND